MATPATATCRPSSAPRAARWPISRGAISPTTACCGPRAGQAREPPGPAWEPPAAGIAAAGDRYGALIPKEKLKDSVIILPFVHSSHVNQGLGFRGKVLAGLGTFGG